MFKFLVVGVLLVLEVNVIFGEKISELSSDTWVPSLSLNPTNDSSNEIPLENKGSLIYGKHQVINFNCPWPWRSPTSFSNDIKEVRSDYTVTKDIGAHKVHVRKVSWNTARQICVDEGGHLAAIRTIEEAQAINALLVKTSVDHLWIGYHDLFKEGDWVTVLDEPIAKMEWTPWSTLLPTNPDNANNNEHCAVYIKSHNGINDDSCDKLFSFVCKIDIFN